MKEHWLKKLKADRDFYSNLCDKLNFQMEEQRKRLALMEKFTGGPPTMMIACEKIVEAATQLTCTANSLIKESRNVPQR
jgi:hypothetical protein